MAMPARHMLLALLVVAVWGTNFVVIRHALDALPPLLLATLRFALAFLPAALLIERPAVPWRQLAAYGLLVGVGQFGLLYVAMRADITPGLASLVVQTQVFMTIGLALVFEGERPRPYQLIGLLLAVAGLVLIGLRREVAGTTVLGLVLVLLAALSWAAANLVGRRAGRVNMLGYMVWSSGFAIVPLLVLSLLLEGPAAMAQGLQRADPGTWLAVVWQSVGNTLFGYGAWAWLLARHAAVTVSPWALGVPVFGMAAAALFLDEPMSAWKLAAAALVIGALAINALVPRLRRS